MYIMKLFHEHGPSAAPGVYYRAPNYHVVNAPQPTGLSSCRNLPKPGQEGMKQWKQWGAWVGSEVEVSTVTWPISVPLGGNQSHREKASVWWQWPIMRTTCVVWVLHGWPDLYRCPPCVQPERILWTPPGLCRLHMCLDPSISRAVGIAYLICEVYACFRDTGLLFAWKLS